MELTDTVSKNLDKLLKEKFKSRIDGLEKLKNIVESINECYISIQKQIEEDVKTNNQLSYMKHYNRLVTLVLEEKVLIEENIKASENYHVLTLNQLDELI